MSGTVNGVKVMGTGQKITVPSSSSSGSSSTWFNQFSHIYSLTLSTLGMLSSMGMLFIMFKQWRGEKTQKSNDIVNNSPDPKKNKDSIQKAQEASDQQIDSQMKPKAEQQTRSAQTDVKNLSSTSQELAKANQQVEARETIEVQSEKVTELLKEAPPSDKTEDAVSDLMQSKELLSKGDVDGAFKNLNDASSTVVEMSEQTGSQMTEAQKAQAETIKQDMDSSARQQESIEKAQQELAEEQSSDSKTEIPEDRLTDEPTIEPFGE
jgi:hypothetical protein